MIDNIRTVEGMQRIPKLLTLILPTTIALGTLISPPAATAASGANLVTTWVAPTSTPVRAVGHYEVRIANTGSRASGAVSVVIQLPATVTSPTVTARGVVTNLTAGCSRSGARVTCSLTAIAKNTTRTLSFDMALPYATTAHTFRADATTTNETFAANNGASHTAVVSYFSPTVAAPATVTNSHCTGSTLTSYFECELYPSSIASHAATFVDNGSGPNSGAIDFTIVNGPAYADYAGTWSVSGSQLTFEYTELGSVTVTFIGQGTSANCWEGKVTFVPTSNYVSMYKVCI